MPQLKTAFDEDNLRHLVYTFYGRVREDPLLGPIFGRAIGDDEANWAPHLETMTAFWHSMVLHKGTYRGNPLVRHKAVGGIEPAHFTRWLLLFEQVAREVYDERTANQIVARAHTMGRHLSRNLREGSA